MVAHSHAAFRVVMPISGPERIFLVVPLTDAIICRRLGWALLIFFVPPLGGMAWMRVGHRWTRRS